jgi:hypothetical protein
MFDYLADTNAPEGLLHNETMPVDAPIIPTKAQDYVDVLQEFTNADRIFTGVFIAIPPVLGTITGITTKLVNDDSKLILRGIESLLMIAAASFSIGSLFYDKNNENEKEINSSQHTQAAVWSFVTPVLLAQKFSENKLFSWLK